MDRTDIICLVGATGAGKTAASLALGETFDGAVVNLDSRQVYKDFPVITAQPSPKEQQRLPHYLYGFLDTTEKITAGKFADLASQAIQDVREHGKTPLIVGGTGLYLRALVEGLAPIPKAPAEVTAKVFAELAEQGLPALRTRLENVDPEYAAKIHPNDAQRTQRALEVFDATGKPLSWWHAVPSPPSPYRALVLGVEVTLADLTPRLAQRIDIMLEMGAVDEARAAWERCKTPQAPGWSGIGCAELLRHIQGELPMPECKELWLRNTRAYAKRQLTWFKKDKSIQWRAPDDISGMLAAADHFLQSSEAGES